MPTAPSSYKHTPETAKKLKPYYHAESTKKPLDRIAPAAKWSERRAAEGNDGVLTKIGRTLGFGRKRKRKH